MSTSSPQKKKVWIDTDIIFNKAGKEVDDGLALMMAFNNETIDIRGISLIHKVDNGYKVTKKLLGYYSDKTIPVYKGTDDASKGPGTKTEAVEQLAQALMEDELTVIAIGPATNIANLLEFYPEAAKNIKDIVFCAGRRPSAVFKPKNSKLLLPDYNFEIDPASFKKVLESDLHITLSGYEASSSIYLYKEDLKKIKRNGRKGDKWVYRKLRSWLWGWSYKLNVTGFIPFDTCTIGHVLYPDYFEYDRDIPVTINTRENDCDSVVKNDQKQYLELSYEYESPYKVDFVYKTDPRYKEVVMKNLLGK